MREIYHFILHLRLHYQLFLLSGGFLLGGLMAGVMDTHQFWAQYLNVHVLLFGGATAFNSYWDKDEGPIGGLKNPPKMTYWMHPASLIFMLSGWAWSLLAGVTYFIVYGLSLLLFWLYSTPHARWKGDPHLSLVAIALSTGFNSVLLGCLAAGGSINPVLLISAFGASLVLLSLYPVSQIYQVEEDLRRGDKTFAGRYGVKGVKKFYLISFFSGLILLCLAMGARYFLPALVLFIIGSISGVIIQQIIVKLIGSEAEYTRVMNVKFIASLSFVLFLLFSNAILYKWIDIEFFRNLFN